jgi:hypothetical protein
VFHVNKVTFKSEGIHEGIASEREQMNPRLGEEIGRFKSDVDR